MKSERHIHYIDQPRVPACGILVTHSSLHGHATLTFFCFIECELSVLWQRIRAAPVQHDNIMRTMGGQTRLFPSSVHILQNSRNDCVLPYSMIGTV